MSDFQVKLDQLIEDLDLTLEEREFVQRHWKTNRTARRVMNLFTEAVEDRTFDKRQVLLRHLFEAVQKLRLEMSAACFVPPEGFALVADEVLETFRHLAALQLELAEMGSTDRGRSSKVSGSFDLARAAAEMDPEVAACSN